MSNQDVEIAVIGAGPAGLASALALARLGLSATIVAPPYDPDRAATDRRTTALFGPSVDFLKNINAWHGCVAEAAIISAVRIADDRGALLRAPEVTFLASELGMEAFGANIPNPVLIAALEAATRLSPGLRRIDTAAVRAIEPTTSDVRLHLAEGRSVRAQLVVAADGRKSLGPAAAGLSLRAWAYPQAAVATRFSHSRPHGSIVNELHRRAGPLTTVPLPSGQSSLVWVESPEEARRLADLSSAAFGETLEERLQGILGTISEIESRSVYPLSGATAERMGRRRIALMGEAAHVVPPIGAQGLNLGLRDAAALAQCVADAAARGEDVGANSVMDAYHEARTVDIATRSATIDLLNRSLLVDFAPLDAARGAAVHLIARAASLRQMLMREGLGSTGILPRLMRPTG